MRPAIENIIFASQLERKGGRNPAFPMATLVIKVT